MPGIEDLTNIMVAGGRTDLPSSPGATMAPTAPPQLAGGPPMGGPPMGGPPMGGPPMGGPPTAETLMANADMLGGDMQRAPMEGPGGGGIEQDAMALADAVIGRAQGDTEAALAILDGAAQIVMGAGQQEQGLPMPPEQGLPMPPEQPMMAAHGRAISDRDSDQLGRTLSDRDLASHLAQTDTDPTDVLRSLLSQQRYLYNQQGREMSDADLEQLAYSAAEANGQTGRTLSDEDLKFYLDMIGRTTSDRDMKVGKPGYNRRTIRRAGGGSLMTQAGQSEDDYDQYLSALAKRRTTY